MPWSGRDNLFVSIYPSPRHGEQENILMRYKKFLGILWLAAVLPVLSFADTTREINAKVDAALARFHKEIGSADRFLAETKAVLVLPQVIKGGFIVAGEYGEGVLMIGGKITDYYNVFSASFGLTAGGEMKDFIILFFSDEALKKFRARDGWEAGVDGNIAIGKDGAGMSADATRINEPIVAFVVGVKGLLVDASFKGSKFSLLKK
jgi:lipid-binding SYLF domain-containing protein